MRSDTAVTSVIVYDGACAFCRKAIEGIRKRDRKRQFRYLPRQTPGLDEKYPELALANFDTGMRLIQPDGTVHIGADAIYVISSKLPFFRWFAWTYQVPLIKAVTRGIYSWVATNRLKLSRYCNSHCEITAEADLVSENNAASYVSVYQFLISIIIVLVIGLHLWADAAKAVARSSWMGDRSWPFLAYGMYRQSYQPGTIQTTKRRIIALTNGRGELEVNRSMVGMARQALHQHYVNDMIGGNPTAASRLAARINLDREDPITAFRVESETYTITAEGVVTGGKQSTIYPAAK